VFPLDVPELLGEHALASAIAAAKSPLDLTMLKFRAKVILSEPFSNPLRTRRAISLGEMILKNYLDILAS
jgi:hypothetical protein